MTEEEDRAAHNEAVYDELRPVGVLPRTWRLHKIIQTLSAANPWLSISVREGVGRHEFTLKGYVGNKRWVVSFDSTTVEAVANTLERAVANTLERAVAEMAQIHEASRRAMSQPVGGSEHDYGCGIWPRVGETFAGALHRALPKFTGEEIASDLAINNAGDLTLNTPGFAEAVRRLLEDDRSPVILPLPRLPEPIEYSGTPSDVRENNACKVHEHSNEDGTPISCIGDVPGVKSTLTVFCQGWDDV